VPQILRIQTSFSKEYVKIEWSKLPNYLWKQNVYLFLKIKNTYVLAQ
jgi:hypothetical protein